MQIPVINGNHFFASPSPSGSTLVQIANDWSSRIQAPCRFQSIRKMETSFSRLPLPLGEGAAKRRVRAQAAKMCPPKELENRANVFNYLRKTTVSQFSSSSFVETRQRVLPEDAHP